jgi:prepilin-type N-terminal cleavage/methylation domain-containing protein
MMNPTRTLVMNRSATRDAGFSLIEVLIAMGIVVIAIVGLLPLFMRSVVENIEGRESTMVGNQGRSQLETFSELTFNNWELDINAGTERTTQDFYTTGAADRRGDESWVTTVPAGEIAPWTRTSTVRQFGINGIVDNDLDGIIDEIRGLEDNDFDGEFDNPLPVGTIPGAIHLKQLEVQIQGQKQWAQGGDASEITVETVKAF